jgi:hypothetical protein
MIYQFVDVVMPPWAALGLTTASRPAPFATRKSSVANI